MSEIKSRGTEFPHGATVRELAAVLAAVPEEEQDREVDVMFTPMGIARAEGRDLPGVIWAFDPFPETTVDPQPAVACWTIRAMDGLSTAAELETLSTFQEFLESPEHAAAEAAKPPYFRDDDAFDLLYSRSYDELLSDMKNLVREYMVGRGWAVLEGDHYLLTEEGLDELRGGIDE